MSPDSLRKGSPLATTITQVNPGSIAQRLGIEAGDRIVRIAGEMIIDQIDYQALTAQKSFDLEVIRRDGTRKTYHVHKQDWEPLGLVLDQSIVCNPRSCSNKCIFCFIDQMPPGMRNTLYVKDDDWRLSLMMGNYVTLTNVGDREFDRILRRKVSPLFISVHTTDPVLRKQMLKNRRADQIMDRLQQLKDAGIRFHCQVVLCPGWNDGAALRRTLDDLKTMLPAVQSVALVPVGLTKYRDGLDHIDPYTAEGAARLVETVTQWQEAFLQEMGTRFVFPSDEFYCLSGLPLPSDEAYEHYPQLENGVGMLRMFETDLRYAVEDSPVAETPPRRLLIACGTSVAPFLQAMADQYAPRGTKVEVRPIINHFFGPSVTVSGLITGGDLIRQLQDVDCDHILITRSMLRNEGDLFLDDTSLEEVRARLPAPLHPVDSSGEGFWRAISGMEGY